VRQALSAKNLFDSDAGQDGHRVDQTKGHAAEASSFLFFNHLSFHALIITHSPEDARKNPQKLFASMGLLMRQPWAIDP
jgi:hypothetical protein